MYCNISDSTTFSSTFDIKERLEIGLKFSRSSESSDVFFNNGLTIAVLKINGNSPVKREWLTAIVNVGSIASKHSKNSDVGIASSSQVLGAH